MDVTIRHNPSFAVARCTLAGGEQVRVESGAMMSTSGGVSIEAKMEGGFMKSLKRATLGGESLFVTTYTAPAQGGFVDVAANLPGDLLMFDVAPDRPLLVQRGSWLASDTGVSIETKWGGAKNLFGGEGGFVVRASGQGTIVASCYGAMEVWDLAPGQNFTLDTGHMVAYEESVQYSLRRAAEKGLVQSAKSGEGFVFDFVGPGKVYTQTRNPSALIDWLTTVLPFTRS
jgi:uncharacterized protein (TIGR00266 family)